MPAAAKTSIAEVKAALTRTGNVGEAAELLGCTEKALQSRIKRSKELTKFMQPQKEEADTLHRKDNLQTPLTEKQAIAEAMDAEDAALKKGLKSIGLGGPGLKEAMALQAFHNTQFQKSYEMIGGGITKMFFDLKAEVSAINERLSDGGMDIEEENMLRSDRSRLLEQLGKTYDRSLKAAMTQAVINHRLSDKGRSGPSSKPGFQPITNNIAIKTDGNVSLDSSQT